MPTASREDRPVAAEQADDRAAEEQLASLAASHDPARDDELLPPGRPWLRVADRIGLVGVALVAVAVRLFSTSALWLDEALSVNIARLPVADIPDALRWDGHPPLYYVVLHGWMQLFGESNLAVRSLSAVFGLAVLPLLWIAGRRLGGRRQATATLLVIAVLPFAVRYSTEARMYSLVMLLVAAGWLLVDDTLRAPTWPRLAAVALLGAALLWTHYWAMWLLAAMGIGLLWRAWRARRRGSPESAATALRVAGALVVSGVLFLPWLPVLLYQSAHTGTPWGGPQRPTAVLGDSLIDMSGGATPEGTLGALITALLLTLGIFGFAVARHHVALDLRTVPAARRALLVVTTTMVVAEVASYATASAYQTRYLAMVVIPMILIMGRGHAQVIGPVAFRVLLVTMLGIYGAGAIRNTFTNRTQATQVADSIEAGYRGDDLVVVCPDQLGPSLIRELPAGTEVVSYPELRPAERVDWRDYVERLDAHDPADVADQILARAEGRQIWVTWSSTYVRTHQERCNDLIAELRRTRPWGDDVVWESEDVFEKLGVVQFAPTEPS